MSRSRRRSLRSAHAKKWVKLRAEAHHRRNHEVREEGKEQVMATKREKPYEVVTLYWAHPSWKKDGPGILVRELRYRRSES